MTTDHDDRVRRCPLLGHEVAFSYCRCPGRENPCDKMLDCWHETFDIRTYVAERYGEETLKAMARPPKPKMLSLLEIIEQAQKNSHAS
jgi:hypothetical protein